MYDEMEMISKIASEQFIANSSFLDLVSSFNVSSAVSQTASAFGANSPRDTPREELLSLNYESELNLSTFNAIQPSSYPTIRIQDIEFAADDLNAYSFRPSPGELLAISDLNTLNFPTHNDFYLPPVSFANNLMASVAEFCSTGVTSAAPHFQNSSTGITPATLPDYTQSSNKDPSEILNRALESSSAAPKLLPVQARKDPDRPVHEKRHICPSTRATEGSAAAMNSKDI
ncbi:hypothetical protein CDAR_90351 [Caerostris darwini]|uniref:Uncharacterized protein n=1 Tax=Caerostris darwini TaxID=1538125 RepID=A0AAV4QZ14_9ARAC|nr:hypothetical protein CDAR_90351 [Caerostris darwini]